MSMKRRLFPAAFKSEAVERVAASGLPAGKAAVEPGLHETVLRRWIKEAGTMAPGRPRRPGVRALTPLPSDLAAENARLRRENDRLRMEREILKKTVAVSGAAQR